MLAVMERGLHEGTRVADLTLATFLIVALGAGVISRLRAGLIPQRVED